MLPVITSADTDVLRPAEARPYFDQHLFQASGTDHGAEEIDQGQVSITNAMEQNHIPDKIGVRLLPKRLLALAPDRRDDGGDIECLRVGIKRVVQRVVADIAVERDLDII